MTRVVGPQPTPSDVKLRLKVRIQGFDLDAQVAFEPKDLIARLAALVPPPKFHLLPFRPGGP